MEKKQLIKLTFEIDSCSECPKHSTAYHMRGEFVDIFCECADRKVAEHVAIEHDFAYDEEVVPSIEIPEWCPGKIDS